MKEHPTSAQPVKKKPLYRRILRGLLLTIVGFYAYSLIGLVYLKFFPPLYTMVQIQQGVEGILGGDLPSFKYRYKPASELSRHVPHAVVAAEDTRFFEHTGIDWDALEQALEENERSSRVRGGSTISQQLVKNLFFTTHRSYLRKGLELTLTPVAEFILGKSRILELYVNVVEWGPGIYGADAAAEYHYGVAGSQLSRVQAARLAACLPSPKTRSPQRMTRYGNIILSRMRVLGW